MTRSSAVVFRLAAALLLAACAASAGTTETAPAAGPEAAWRATASFTDRILVDNDPWTAEAFLADRSYQEGLKKSDAALYQRTFARAAELVDLKGLLDGTATARSIRLGVLKRLGCVFCLQAPAYRAWAEKHLKYLDAAKLPAIEAALWSWTALSPAQQAWIAGKKLDAGWGAMPFVRRHELMREWALAEREALLKANPADNTAMESYYARAGAIAQILGNHELSGVWNRADEAAQASASLAEARAKVGRNADPRVKALLAEATSAADPAARLSALSRLFEGLGRRPRASCSRSRRRAPTSASTTARAASSPRCSKPPFSRRPKEPSRATISRSSTRRRR
ncbi:MAG: hypothetical protein M0D55_05585 [Elusimicrobiota bacterium]|nr:MAG: hypothetical protein M0D55_05585 [Elusimicrobiota bacterium]